MLEYHESQCENIKSHCASGKSLESFCAYIGVSPKVINEWYQEYPDFREAVEMSPCLELLYWEEKLLDVLASQDREILPIVKSRIDNLMKYVTSPIKKETYNNFKEDNSLPKLKSSGDLVKDYNLIMAGNTKLPENNSPNLLENQESKS